MLGQSARRLEIVNVRRGGGRRDGTNQAWGSISGTSEISTQDVYSNMLHAKVKGQVTSWRRTPNIPDRAGGI